MTLSLAEAFERARVATSSSYAPYVLWYALVLAFNSSRIRTSVEPQFWEWSRIALIDGDDNAFLFVADTRDRWVGNVKVCGEGLDLWCANAVAEVERAWWPPETVRPMGWNAEYLRQARKKRKPTVPAELVTFNAKWSSENPQSSDKEFWNAAEDEFPDQHYTRQQIEAVRRPQDGTPRTRGRKPGKGDAEHSNRMKRKW
jgi:hypothetical protein